MDPSSRKARVLTAIIEYYIDTGEPLGSKALVEMLGGGVSSATIRNDMAALTDEGYLEQPHTSAGRLPTVKAFRLYVDHLLRRRPLSEQDKQDIDDVLYALSGDANRLLEDASRALADITGMAAVASRPKQDSSCISRIDVIQMSPRNMAVVLVEDNGFLRTRMCRCQRDIPSKVTVALANYMSHRFLGKSLSVVTITAMQEIMLELGELGLAVAPILSAFYELVKEGADSRVMVAGQMNLLRHPGYEPNQARSLMHYLTEREAINDVLLGQPDEGMQILLGDDCQPDPKGSGMILTHYSLGDRGKGTIGIIGPLRMNYADAIPRVAYFADAIGRLLSELFEETAALDI